MILLFTVPGAGLLGVGALVLGLSGVSGLWGDSLELDGALVSAAAAAFLAALLGLCSWVLIRKAARSTAVERHITFENSPVCNWILLIITAVAIAAGAALSTLQPAWIGLAAAPALTLVAIFSPLLLITGLALRGIDLGPVWRAAEIVGLGLTLGPIIIVSLEIAFALAALVLLAAVLAAQPETAAELMAIAAELQSVSNPTEIARLAAPYLLRPGVLASLYGFVAILVPIIEEMIKPLGVWFFATRLRSTPEGFGWGALSGGAYALVESLGVTGQGGQGWEMVMAVRASTGLLHITTAALMGWAIASVFREHKFLRLACIYALAVAIHGLWNGSAVAVAIASLAAVTTVPPWTVQVGAAGVIAFALLFTGLPAILLTMNRRMRLVQAQQHSETLLGRAQGRVQKT